jgi:hypothetical protein
MVQRQKETQIKTTAAGDTSTSVITMELKQYERLKQESPGTSVFLSFIRFDPASPFSVRILMNRTLAIYEIQKMVNCQLHTEFYTTFFSSGQLHMQIKLLGTTNVEFVVIDQRLITFSVSGRYWRKSGSVMV